MKGDALEFTHRISSTKPHLNYKATHLNGLALLTLLESEIKDGGLIDRGTAGSSNVPVSGDERLGVCGAMYTRALMTSPVEM